MTSEDIKAIDAFFNTIDKLEKKVKAIEEWKEITQLFLNSLEDLPSKVKDLEDWREPTYAKVKELTDKEYTYHEPMMTAWNNKHEQRLKNLEDHEVVKDEVVKALDARIQEVNNSLHSSSVRVKDIEDWKLKHMSQISNGTRHIPKEVWEEILLYVGNMLVEPEAKDPQRNMSLYAKIHGIKDAIRKVDKDFCPE